MSSIPDWVRMGLTFQQARELQDNDMRAVKTANQIKWNATKNERDLISLVVNRVKKMDAHYDPMDCRMDITACHLNACPLDLKALVTADDFNFAHDVYGIRRHINRDTAQLENCFVPRFAKQ